jgi:hypothetical protein
LASLSTEPPLPGLCCTHRGGYSLQVRKLIVGVTIGLTLAFDASAQTTAGTGTSPPATGTIAPDTGANATASKKVSKKKTPQKKSSKKAAKKTSKKKKKATHALPKRDMDEQRRNALESLLPATPAAAPAATPGGAGSSGSLPPVDLEAEKKIIVKQPSEPLAITNVVVEQQGGAPPAITHTPVTQASKGHSIAINARFVGDTGVQAATVMFRHAGEKEYKALAMDNAGGDNYTATVPGQMASSDIEYYLEASDRYGHGPSRSGDASTPYLVKVNAPAIAAAMTQPPTKPPERDTLIGIGFDAGAPGGGGFTLLVRPLWWLRLNGGIAYNYAGFGFRGGLSLAPCWCAVTPTLNLDAGRFLSGDFNKFASVSDPNARALLSHVNYTFATAQLGLEFGSQRWFNFYLRGGLAYFESSFSGADLTALAQGKIASDPSTRYKAGDGKFTSVAPCLSLGFQVFVY